jgi:PAS domain S-box-containing protein
VLILGYSLTHFQDPGTRLGFAYALISALVMSWGIRQLNGARITRAADALFVTVLSADALATYSSPSHWAGGILPVLAASLILPYFSGTALRRRLLAAFLVCLCGMVLHPLIPRASRATAAFLTWYPVVTTSMGVSLVLYALLLFHRSLQQDLSRRAASRESAAESALRYRQVVEASGQGVWIFDSEGRDVFVNERLTRMLGAESGLLGGSVLGLIDAAGKKEILRSLYQGKSRAEAMEIGLRLAGGGEMRALLSLNVMLDATGRVSGAVGMLRDISGRKAMEERLRQAERLDDVARLAGAMASDLEAELLGLGEGAAALEAELPSQGPLHDDLAAILNAAARAGGLLGQLKAFSRRQKMEPQDLDLGALIRAMRATLERACGEAVSLSMDTPTGLGLVKADTSQIEQVLLNLAVNSRDAMPGGGRVELRLDRHQLSPDEALKSGAPFSGPCLRLRVGDNGSGIEAANLDRVFEPFFSTKGRGKGTGLGLATVYGIVRQSGGGLRLRSTPGAGTEMEIFFPCSQEAP